MEIKEKTIALIDALKATCQTYGMGNDGNEYKIITQVFLYKFINDKFGYEIKRISNRLAGADKWETDYEQMTEEERWDVLDELSPDVPRLYPEHLISNLWNQQAKGDFDLIFDSTMTDIADKNMDIFSTQTTQKTDDCWSYFRMSCFRAWDFLLCVPSICFKISGGYHI